METFSLTIVGAGVGSTILDGGNDSSSVLLQISGKNDTGTGAEHYTVRDISFRNAETNSSTGRGLAINSLSTGASATVKNCEFSGNHQRGLEIRTSFPGSQTVEGNTFRGNGLGAGAGSDPGAGARLEFGGGTVTVKENSFEDNQASSGGGIIIQNGHKNVTSTILLDDNSFTGNSASSGSALDIDGRFTDNMTVTATNNIISGNTSTFFGAFDAAIWGNGSTVNIINNTFTDNNLTHPNPLPGTSIHIEYRDGTSVANIYNNILWDPSFMNNFSIMHDQISIDNDSDVNSTWGIVNFFNNIYESISIRESGGLVMGNNMVSKDPLFVDVSNANPANWNLHIKATSPAENSGLNSAPGIPGTDYDGETRVMDGTADMGADEITAAGSTQPPTSLKGGGAGCSIVDSGNDSGGMGTFSILILLSLIFVIRRRF